jgi:hypothetical protein
VQYLKGAHIDQKYAMLRRCTALCSPKKARGSPAYRLTTSTSSISAATSTSTGSTTTTTSSNSAAAVVAQYEALLRKILPLQHDNLAGFLDALKDEREKLEVVCQEFDEKLKQMESIREEIRSLVCDADRRSLERRDEIVASLRE